MTREPTRTECVRAAGLMHQRHGVPIHTAAAVLRVSVVEVRIWLGVDRSVS